MAEILVLNAGSSSLKFAIFEQLGDDPALKLRGQIAGLGGDVRFEAFDCAGAALPAPAAVSLSLASHAEAQQLVLEWLAQRGINPQALAGTGHRIVHGGTRYVCPTLVDDDVQASLEALRSLAPLHLPFGLGALQRMHELAPGVPQVACFDTAFHADQPDVAVRLPLPRRYHERGYRRYGFHGLNYEHVVNEIARRTAREVPRRVLVAHLGNGASMCAIMGGRSVATTMGYSTADGLIMGTRTGSLDPGVLIALMRDEGFGEPELENLLYRESGLKGLSGLTGDMRALLASNKDAAREAVEHYCYWAARHAGSLVTALAGLDAVVFTGGIGENAAAVRAEILAHLAWLGLVCDEDRNQAGLAEISPAGAVCPIWIIPANEELTIARHTQALLGSTAH